MKHRIAVISDTHGLIRPEVLEEIKKCDEIIHAGDIDDRNVLNEFQQLKPLHIVRGNADEAWGQDISKTLEFNLYGVNIFLVHNKKDIKKKLTGVDVVIYGHSHKYEDKEVAGVRYINPGSCGPRRFYQAITMAIMTIDEETRSMEVSPVNLSPVLTKDNVNLLKLSNGDYNKLIKNVVASINRGETVDEIALNNRIDRKLAEQICRMYVTHPGIDVDGILDRLELRSSGK